MMEIRNDHTNKETSQVGRQVLWPLMLRVALGTLCLSIQMVADTYIDLNADAHMAASSFGFLTEDKVSFKCLELDRTWGLTLTPRLQATQVTGASDPADGTSTSLFKCTHSQKSWQVCQIPWLGPP